MRVPCVARSLSPTLPHDPPLLSSSPDSDVASQAAVSSLMSLFPLETPSLIPARLLVTRDVPSKVRPSLQGLIPFFNQNCFLAALYTSL